MSGSGCVVNWIHSIFKQSRQLGHPGRAYFTVRQGSGKFFSNTNFVAAVASIFSMKSNKASVSFIKVRLNTFVNTYVLGL